MSARAMARLARACSRDGWLRTGLVGWVAWLAASHPIAAWAASPEPTAAPGGDPRSSGQGPGLMGDPVAAVLLTFAVGVGATVATYAYVRVTATRARSK